jgi:hypothetical protein
MRLFFSFYGFREAINDSAYPNIEIFTFVNPYIPLEASITASGINIEMER